MRACDNRPEMVRESDGEVGRLPVVAHWPGRARAQEEEYMDL